MITIPELLAFPYKQVQHERAHWEVALPQIQALKIPLDAEIGVLEAIVKLRHGQIT